MKDRLKQIRKEAKLSQAEFASQLGVSLTIIQAWENGRRNPSSSSVYMIADKYNVRREWLETGEEPMRWPEPDRDEEAEIVSELLENVSDPVCTLVKNFMAVYIGLDKPERETAKKIAIAILDRLKNNNGSDAT